MKGKNLVIGLVLFVLVAIAAIYFAMQATINKVGNGMEQTVAIVEVADEVDYLLI